MPHVMISCKHGTAKHMMARCCSHRGWDHHYCHKTVKPKAPQTEDSLKGYPLNQCNVTVTVICISGSTRTSLSASRDHHQLLKGLQPSIEAVSNSKLHSEYICANTRICTCQGYRARSHYGKLGAAHDHAQTVETCCLQLSERLPSVRIVPLLALVCSYTERCATYLGVSSKKYC